MGNCQAVDAASLVIEHPGGGKAQRLYWPISACEVMRQNPGHYVALLLSSSTTTTTATTTDATAAGKAGGSGHVRVTRIKLLRPTDTLLLGHVYRLITTQEVMKGLWAKKCAKMRKNNGESGAEAPTTRRSHTEEIQVKKKPEERQRQRVAGSTMSNNKSRTWQPSLQSISESAS